MKVEADFQVRSHSEVRASSEFRVLRARDGEVLLEQVQPAPPYPKEYTAREGDVVSFSIDIEVAR